MIEKVVAKKKIDKKYLSEVTDKKVIESSGGDKLLKKNLIYNVFCF